ASGRSRRARAAPCDARRPSHGRADVRRAEVSMSRPVLIGSEVLVATPAAALAASVPAALRLANDPAGFFECWLATAGLLCPLLALSIAMSRVARRAARGLAPSAGIPFLFGLALWALASLPATAVLGAMLKANTHHRALAGATFAVLALGAQL